MIIHDTAIKNEAYDRLKVKVYASRREMGRTAGKLAAEKIKLLLSEKQSVRMIFAAAPSQKEFLETLSQEEGIDWSRITAFHMDEYIGLSDDAPQKFGKFLCDMLFDIVKPGKVHLIDSSSSIEAECKRYSQLIKEAPIDIVCLGIGENGHIAFNDPPVADSHHKQVIKVVELDSACRRQQVNDGCFPSLDGVPTHALTLTIPTMMEGKYLYCIVPGESKREAVKNALHGEISTACPASVLRLHPDCTLFVDSHSYS
jgi:glucosamine-6-phosphate deaminase